MYISGWLTMAVPAAPGRAATGSGWKSLLVTEEGEAPELELPEPVRRLYGREPVELVRRNILGGLTYRISAGTTRDRYLKWAPATAVEIDLAAEAERLTWAVDWITVPRVLDAGADSGGSWLMTTALPGRSAVDPRWRDHPELAVTAIGQGLRALHDTLPVDRCPFTWSVANRTAQLDSPGQAAALLRSTPPPVGLSCVTATRAHPTPCWTTPDASPDTSTSAP